MNDHDPLQEVLTTLSLLVVSQPPTDTLAHVAELARDGIEHVDYVAVTAVRGGEPATTAATDPLVAVIDQAQYDVGAGPCLDAAREGRAFRIDETLDDSLPWPEFRAAAVAAGVHSTLSLPLVAAGVTIGALNLYSRRPGAFPADAVAQVERFTEPAATLLLNAYLLWDARVLAENLEAALDSKSVIEQAKGLLMARQGIGAEEAFDLLRRASQRENVKLREIAQRLVDQAEARARTICSARAAHTTRAARTARSARSDGTARPARVDGVGGLDRIDGNDRNHRGDGVDRVDGNDGVDRDHRGDGGNRDDGGQEPLGAVPDPSVGPATPPAGTTVT